MSDTLSKQLEEYRAGWMQRVPADRRAIMERHIQYLTETGFARRSKQVGDMYVQVVVETPQNLTKRQRELLAEFQKLSSNDTNPESAGFFGRVKEFFGTRAGSA